MFHKADFNFFSIEDLFIAYSGLYADEHGMKKVKEIEAKVEDSKNMRSLIFNTVHGRDIPPVDDFLALLNTVPYFIFSKAETACLGALIAMRGCIYGINPVLAEERSGKWHEMTVEVIHKCHRQKMSSNTLFDTYYLKLERMKNEIEAMQNEHAGFTAPATTSIDMKKVKVISELFDIIADNHEFRKMRHALSEEHCGFGHIETCEWDVSEKERRLWTNFNKRFQLSNGILILGFVNFYFKSNGNFDHHTMTYFNSQICKSILGLRREVVNTTPDGYFLSDDEPVYGDNLDVSTKFETIINSVVNDIINIHERKYIKNVFSFFDRGLGMVLPPIKDEYPMDLNLSIMACVSDTIKVVRNQITMIQ